MVNEAKANTVFAYLLVSFQKMIDLNYGDDKYFGINLGNSWEKEKTSF